jgi:hypothetical protein
VSISDSQVRHPSCAYNTKHRDVSHGSNVLSGNGASVGRNPGAVGFFTLRPLVVVRHLQAGSPEAALDVEALVGLTAVEDGLVAARLLGDKVECLDDAQPQLLALLILGNGDILDVSDRPEAVDAVGGPGVS